MASIKGDDGISIPVVPDRSYGVWGQSASGAGVIGTCALGPGVEGLSDQDIGVRGLGAPGVFGQSQQPGTFDGERFVARGIPGVQGVNDIKGGTGVEGQAEGSFGAGVWGHASMGIGVLGEGRNGVVGVGGNGGTGVLGAAGRSGIGVQGSGEADGVAGNSQTGTGVHGQSASGIGAVGESDTGIGVKGTVSGGQRLDPPLQNVGVFGDSATPFGIGVIGRGPNVGVAAFNAGSANAAYLAGRSVAGWFTGQVVVTGALLKGGGGFLIDHPADPERQLLAHSFVESSEMKNLYDGIAVLDENGAAVVNLPAWFEALNGQFRYQLTALGKSAPTMHVSQEVQNGAFRIAGGPPGGKVCWQVTGIRRDPWANANPLVVEQLKSEDERGHFLHPELRGAATDQGIGSIRHSLGPPKR